MRRVSVGLSPGTHDGASRNASIDCVEPATPGTTSECTACTAPCGSICLGKPGGGFRTGFGIAYPSRANDLGPGRRLGPARHR
jgi:hypothetical protein